MLWCFKECYFNSRFARMVGGVGINHLGAGKFSGVDVPLAPLPEQRRIADKLDELLSDLDKGVEALERVRRNLERYRASVLKAAVEGRLVPTEFQLAKDESREPESVEVALGRMNDRPSAKPRRAGRLWGAGVVPELRQGERDALSKGWVWAKVRDLGPDPEEVVQVGPMSMKSKEFEREGVPVLNVGCVQWDRFDEHKLNHLPADKVKAFSRYIVRQDDIMFTRSGTVGRCAVVKSHQDGWLMTFHLLRVRVHSRVCRPKYLRIVFEGAPHIARQRREASIGTTRAGFNTRLLAELAVPLPPVSEQDRIIAEVERLLSLASALEQAASSGSSQSSRLRQSILKSAFEGHLVPQDPNDEPASALLERIRAAKAAEVPVKKKRKAKKKSKTAARPKAKRKRGRV
jgi:type I restriction enzyme S subunit